MRYPTSEKLEIIRVIEQSYLPVKKTLDQFGIARRTFYRWYDRYVEGGPEALEDRPSRPGRVWNRIGAEVQSQINVTPTDAYFGRASAIIEQRERIKRRTAALLKIQFNADLLHELAYDLVAVT